MLTRRFELRIGSSLFSVEFCLGLNFWIQSFESKFWIKIWERSETSNKTLSRRLIKLLQLGVGLLGGQFGDWNSIRTRFERICSTDSVQRVHQERTSPLHLRVDSLNGITRHRRINSPHCHGGPVEGRPLNRFAKHIYHILTTHFSEY